MHGKTRSAKVVLDMFGEGDQKTDKEGKEEARGQGGQALTDYINAVKGMFKMPVAGPVRMAGINFGGPGSRFWLQG